MWLWSDHVVLGDHHSGLRIEAAAVRIEAQQITEVRPCDAAGWEALRRSESGPCVSLQGKMLTPAFINAHAHLPMAAYRGLGSTSAMRDNVVEELFFRIETAVTDGDVRAFARMGAYESLCAGVAVVWEHYYGGMELVRGLEDAGIAGFVAPTLQDVDGPGVDKLDSQLQATMDLLEDTKAASRGLFPALGPHATDTVSADLWATVAELAQRHDLTVHAHLAQSIEELERAWQRHDVSAAGWLQQLGVLEARALWVHGVFLSEADLGRFDPTKHTLGFCPFSQLQFAFPADVRAWQREGLPWIVATDCAACNDGMGPQKELRFVAGLATGAASYQPEQARFAATGDPADGRVLQRYRQRAFDAMPLWRDPSWLLARVWSIPGELDPRMPSGVIRPGAWAHLLTWDLSHPALWPHTDLLRALALSEPGPALDGVMVGGQWWAQPGRLGERLRSADYAEARQEADQRLIRLLRKVT